MSRLSVALVVVFTGCTATHNVHLVSDPPGVPVEVNGAYLGRTPFLYTFESAYAQKVWPEEVTLVARQSGWTEDVKEFRAMSKLPDQILFVIHPKEGQQSKVVAPSTQGSREVQPAVRSQLDQPPAETDVLDEYETLEEQKRRVEQEGK